MSKDVMIRKFDEFVELFSKESDRAAVILGASMLDQQLYFLLNNYLLPPFSKDDDILQGDNPLATYHARINISHRLGLIDSEFAKALHQIRKIRNEFAHKIDARLDQSPTRDHIRYVTQVVESTNLYCDVVEAYFPEKKEIRTRFFAVIATLAIRLITMNLKTKPISNDPASIEPIGYSSLAEEKGVNK